MGLPIATADPSLAVLTYTLEVPADGLNYHSQFLMDVVSPFCDMICLYCYFLFYLNALFETLLHPGLSIYNYSGQPQWGLSSWLLSFLSIWFNDPSSLSYNTIIPIDPPLANIFLLFLPSYIPTRLKSKSKENIIDHYLDYTEIYGLKIYTYNSR